MGAEPESSDKVRADQLLVTRGLAATRSQAQRLIAAGLRWRASGARGDWRAVGKNGEELPTDAELQLQDTSERRFVSRGGLKLDGALAQLDWSVQGLHCLDVGQSTGGFTDVLLQRGAAQVVGVDVGHGQLHPSLRADPRVCAIEGLNARELQPQDPRLPAQRFDLIVGDLSFISLTLVLPALLPWLSPTGRLLLLVKPQFELQPGQVGKGGIVRDPALYALVSQRLHQCCQALDLSVLAWLDSPIAGGDGNREFWLGAARPPL